MNARLIKIAPFLLVPFTLFSCGESTETTDTSATGGAPTETTQPDDAPVADATPVNTDGPFQVKSGEIHYQQKDLNGKLVAKYKFYFDNYGMTLKLEETREGEVSLYLYDNEAKKGVTQFPGRKANKAYARQGEMNMFVAMRSQSGFVQRDNEAILGNDCEVFANNAVDDAGESKVVYWMHKGICLKEINRLTGGYEFEATHFEEKALDGSTFSMLNEVD